MKALANQVTKILSCITSEEAKTIANARRWHMVSVYSAAHFFVEFACAFLMFRSISVTSDWLLCVLIYNFCAFAMQMPLGILADKLNRNYLLAVVGCVLVGVAYALIHIPIVAAIVAGTGNALFHLGGGIDVLNISEKRSAALGVFAAPGDWGIYFGTIAGMGSSLSAAPALAGLAAAAGLIVAVYRAQGGTYPKNAAFSPYNGAPFPMLPAVVCLFLVVCLRSYVGLTVAFPWENTAHWGLALVCAVALGKAAGGFAADRFGMAGATFFSLTVAAPLFFFPQMPLPGITAMFLFNMTMPVTLWAMVRIFPWAKGFSFGLLSFASFIGFLPAYLGFNVPFNTSWPFALAAVASLVLLGAGLRKAKLWPGR